MDERRRVIKELLEKEQEVRLSELCLRFPEVSVMTLRRDLQFFQDMGFAFRIHGGARIAGINRSEPYYKMREAENREAKAQIAKFALRYLEEGSSIFLDSGTTMMAFGRALNTYNMHIVTTGPNIALELAAASNSTFVLLGGQLNRHNLTISGSMAMDNARNLEIGTAFIAASGYTAPAGFTCGSHSEAELKKLVLSRAAFKVLLLDTSKFGKELLFPFAKVGDFDVIVTEKEPPEYVVALAKDTGTELAFID